MQEVRITTHATTELIDVTGLVQREVAASGVETGLCTVFCPHTTAGLTLNEAADPDVAKDLRDALDRVLPEDVPWRHAEGNSPAHVKASLIGASAHVLIRGGRMALGRWQGIFFCEFDGPRERTMWVQVHA